MWIELPALLSGPYRQPVRLTRAALADAAESAGRWRRRVAGWASQPSRPVLADTASVIRDAFDIDLDTTAALDLLRRTESRRGIPAGAKFDTFPFVDRVLGLELPPRDRPLTGKDVTRRGPQRRDLDDHAEPAAADIPAVSADIWGARAS